MKETAAPLVTALLVVLCVLPACTTEDDANPESTGTYNCYRCHERAIEISKNNWAGTSPGTGHTGNDQDYQEYSQLTGAARVPAGNTGGNIYGFACGNCHGGGAPDVRSGSVIPTFVGFLPRFILK